MNGVAPRPCSGARRQLLAVLALAALTALLLPAGGSAAAETGECAWHHHLKRVVKHVKRHGKRVKVVRKQTFWSCDPIAAAAVPPALPPVAPPTPPPAPGETEPETDHHRLGVSAHDFYFVLSKSELSSGEETIELSNQGQDAHNLHVEAAGGGTQLELPETESSGHASAEVDLAPGTYRLFCSLPEHAEKGMEATLVVTP